MSKEAGEGMAASAMKVNTNSYDSICKKLFMCMFITFHMSCVCIGSAKSSEKDRNWGIGRSRRECIRGGG